MHLKPQWKMYSRNKETGKKPIRSKPLNKSLKNIPRNNEAKVTDNMTIMNYCPLFTKESEELYILILDVASKIFVLLKAS